MNSSIILLEKFQADDLPENLRQQFLNLANDIVALEGEEEQDCLQIVPVLLRTRSLVVKCIQLKNNASD